MVRLAGDVKLFVYVVLKIIYFTVNIFLRECLIRLYVSKGDYGGPRKSALKEMRFTFWCRFFYVRRCMYLCIQH